MGNIALDTKDRRILEELDKNSNIPVSTLAKRVGVSRQVAEYRIKKLLSQKTIYAFYTMVDAGRLGYSSFRIHLRVKKVGKEDYKKFAKALFQDYPLFWVGFVSGGFDIIIDAFAKNPNDFEDVFKDILKKNKNIIQGYEILSILDLDLYDYGYFFSRNKNRNVTVVHKNGGNFKLDKIDKEILKRIKFNSRFSYEEIGRKVNLTRNAVKNRIKKLEEKKIIGGYKIIVNFNHFNKQSFKVFVRYNNSKLDQEPLLINKIRSTPGILNILRFVGKWNLDIEIQVDNIRELQEFIINLRNEFEIVDDYEINQIIEDYGIDFYPDRLK